MKLGMNNEYAKQLQAALMSEDSEAQVKAWNDFSNSIVEEIKRDAEMFNQSQDKNILIQRGYRQLTNAEEKYYNNLIKASRCRNINQAVTTLADLQGNDLMPESIIEDVYRDLVSEHALLSRVNFQSVKYATKMILNDHSKQMAIWGEADAQITKEITSAFKVLELTQNKLSAFACIPMGLLDLGATFLDGYIRLILKDAIACALEEAIVVGDGKGKPVGMMKKLTGAVDGVHQDKEAEAVTEFSVKAMGELIAKMSKDEKGRARKIGKLALIVNSADYYTLVAPAVRVQNMSGAFVDAFPYPVEVIISEFVPSGKGVLADLDRYFVGVGFAKEGVLEFSDEYKNIKTILNIHNIQYQGRYGSLVMILSLIMLGSPLGFLLHNFNPAKIFAGDCATFMGFIISVITLLEFKGPALISFFVPVAILGIPILDTLFAIIRRVLKGQSPMTADRGHLHHRLVDAGLTQKQAVLILYAISAVLGLAGLLIVQGMWKIIILFVYSSRIHIQEQKRF